MRLDLQLFQQTTSSERSGGQSRIYSVEPSQKITLSRLHRERTDRLWLRSSQPVDSQAQSQLVTHKLNCGQLPACTGKSNDQRPSPHCEPHCEPLKTPSVKWGLSVTYTILPLSGVFKTPHTKTFLSHTKTFQPRSTKRRSAYEEVPSWYYQLV